MLYEIRVVIVEQPEPGETRESSQDALDYCAVFATAEAAQHFAYALHETGKEMDSLPTEVDP